MAYFCNPINIPYKYQLLQCAGGASASREAADPSLVLFRGRYYLFPSMTAGFHVSDDLVDWAFHKLPDNIPIYDYAPDVRAIGDYLYFSASKLRDNCPFYRTTDPIGGVFEEIPGDFPFFDPNLFEDEDGRVYFYWGCSNATPIWGVELDRETMKPLGERQVLICANEAENGFERNGENHIAPKTPEMIEAAILETGRMFFGAERIEDIPPEAEAAMRKAVGNDTYIEGAWMTKHNGTYYLQYAATGSEYNVYCDGVYTAKSPLGPFALAKNNPYSYKPSGFIPGAGHGSTMEDQQGNWWHAATAVISVNHQFERRVSLWRAGFDADGELFCDQRFGDWPMRVDQKPWEKPDWMLLSYGKPVMACCGEGMAHVTDENIRTWGEAAFGAANPWVRVDLGAIRDVRAIQINFADDGLKVALPEDTEFFSETDKRIIDQTAHVTRWKLEGSTDGENWFVISDKSDADTDLSHDFIINEAGYACRYVKLTVVELPFGQQPCVSGIRVFGKAEGALPAKADATAKRTGEMDMQVCWDDGDAAGHNILWGHAPDKLYHSCMVFGKREQRIAALIKGQPVYVRVDAFNEYGITEGDLQKLTEAIKSEA